MTGRILVVEDDRDMASMLSDRLRTRGFFVDLASSAAEALAILDQEAFEIVVTDLNMPGFDGIELCRRLSNNRPDLPVILITAFGSMDTAIAAMRVGAHDFIVKPLKIEELVISIERGIQHRLLRDEVKLLRRAVARAQGFEDFLGNSPALRRVFTLIDQVADSDATVMVTGESGTGKELVARALHDRGKRKAGPFVAVNCAALTETLLESELFGHTKGAFTDAKTAHAGLFTQSNGGTLFLDEIGEMTPAMQAKLLRSLETRSVRPVGGTAEIPFDARIIAATNRDLETMVEEGGFRVDLFYRLNVLRLSMPPLRARGNDVLLIAQHFINRQALQTGKPVTGLSPAVAERLLTYTWPGNVRELQNCIERAVAVTRTDQIGEEALPERIRHHRAISLGTEDDAADLPSMAEVERGHIIRVLEKTGGNKTAAAEILGFDRRTLYRKLEHFGLLKAGA